MTRSRLSVPKRSLRVSEIEKLIVEDDIAQMSYDEPEGASRPDTGLESVLVKATTLSVSVLVISLSLFILPSTVSAQPLTLQSGHFQYKPKIWLSSDYDDNVFYEAAQEPNGNLPNHGAVLKVGGGFQVENRGNSPVGVDLNISSAYRQYVYLDDQNGKSEADLETLRQGRNGIDFARLNGRLVLGKQSDVQLLLQDRFSYIERPAYEGTVFGFERVDNRLGTALDFSPGRRVGGGPLGIKLGYELRNVFFLNDGEGLQIQSRSEKQAHTVSLDTRWRFLPKNFLTFDVSYTSNNYNDFPNALDSTGAEVDAEILSRDSTPLRAELGLTGLITSRFSVFLKGGYTNTFNKFGPSYDGFIGLFQLSYVHTPLAEVSLGYQRDARDSGFSNFYILDRFYAKSSLNLSNRLTLTGNFSYDLYQYDAANAVDDTSRIDPVLRAKVGVLTKLPSHFSLQVSYSIEANYTDYQLPIDNPTDFASYQRQLFSLALYFN